jgi:hypothetical protein
MKLVNYTKLQEVLLSNWTKFIDYQTLSEIITNNIELYAANWTTVITTEKLKVKSITLKNFALTEKNTIVLDFQFSIPWKKTIASGAILIECAINQKPNVGNIKGILLSDYA